MSSSNLIKIGWWELHEATLLYGAEIDEFSLVYLDNDPSAGQLKERGSPLIDNAIYSSLLAPIVNYCKIDLSIARYSADQMRQQIWEKLGIEARNKDIETSSSWDSLSRADSIRYVFDDFKGRYHLPADTPPLSSIQLRTVAQHAMWLLFDTYQNEKDRLQSILWGLALIGITKNLLKSQASCQFCFRKTWLGRKYCEVHSQSQSNDANRSYKYMRYRTGKKAHALAKERGLLELIQGPISIIAANNHLMMSDLLFQPALDEEAKSMEREMIIYSLEQSKRVVELTHLNDKDLINLSFDQLVEVLRDNLDCNEWWDEVWKTKILSAELWLLLEAEASPGARGCEAVTTRRIEQAKNLMAQGMNKVEIAKRLGITPSAISKWQIRKSLMTI